MKTAYENWLIQETKKLLSNLETDETEIYAVLLMDDLIQNNPQAFDLVNKYNCGFSMVEMKYIATKELEL